MGYTVLIFVTHYVFFSLLQPYHYPVFYGQNPFRITNPLSTLVIRFPFLATPKVVGRVIMNNAGKEAAD